MSTDSMIHAVPLAKFHEYKEKQKKLWEHWEAAFEKAKEHALQLCRENGWDEYVEGCVARHEGEPRSLYDYDRRGLYPLKEVGDHLLPDSFTKRTESLAAIGQDPLLLADEDLFVFHEIDNMLMWATGNPDAWSKTMIGRVDFNVKRWKDGADLFVVKKESPPTGTASQSKPEQRVEAADRPTPKSHPESDDSPGCAIAAGAVVFAAGFVLGALLFWGGA